MVDFYYKEIPLLQIRYYYGTTEDDVFNITKTIANFSNHLEICTNAL